MMTSISKSACHLYVLCMYRHFRAINVNGDFCYVILNTVEYYHYHQTNLGISQKIKEGLLMTKCTELDVD